jgi:hypothetical protein
MGLSARDRHALTSIESQLAESDPLLAARMAAFSRLANGAEMPATETRRAGWRRYLASLLVLRLGRAQHRSDAPRHSVWASALLVFWVATACALIATAAILGHGPASGRCSVMAVACSSHLPAAHLPNGAR